MGTPDPSGVDQDARGFRNLAGIAAVPALQDRESSLASSKPEGAAWLPGLHAIGDQEVLN